MKKKRLALILAMLAVVITVAAVLIIKLSTSVEPSINADDISSIEISNSHGGFMNGIKTSDREQISVLLECIKTASLNNKYRNFGEQTGPNFFKVTFEYKDGTSETREYKEYPSTKYPAPFKPFYDLFDSET